MLPFFPFMSFTSSSTPPPICHPYILAGKTWETMCPDVLQGLGVSLKRDNYLHFTKHILPKLYWLLTLVIWNHDTHTPPLSIAGSLCSLPFADSYLFPFSHLISVDVFLFTWDHPSLSLALLKSPSSFRLCQHAIHFASHPVTFSQSLPLSFWFYILGCRSFFHSSSLSLFLCPCPSIHKALSF